MAWIEALPASELARTGKAVIRHDGRQILLMHTDRGVFACTNRCPHEGYPLSEGVLTDGCILTCNWHNWKFDLASGATLVGGDRLTRFPAQVRDGSVWLDIVSSDPRERRREILQGMSRALEDADQQRLVREVARLTRLNADPLDAVREAVAWVAERLEFGTTHALAGAPDWIALFDSPVTDADRKLVAIGEIIGHIADDARLSRCSPFPPGSAPWDEVAFVTAVKDEDEASAIGMLRGAVEGGIAPTSLLPALTGAALAHYADFGHSLIYTIKTIALAERLGPPVHERLLLMLARSLVYATREDLLPEFRDYRGFLAVWGCADGDAPPLTAAALRGKAPRAAMATVAAWGAVHPPEAIFPVLVEASAWTLLHVDAHRLTSTEAKLADNIGWLDFTHALTFADAARVAVGARPDLWPAVLLQLACFVGRNSGYVDPAMDVRCFMVDDVTQFLADETDGLFDHGQDRFIISVHLLKTLLAGERLVTAFPTMAPLIAAALNRFLHAPMKGRHALRTARQMRELVAEE
ncbi:MAG: Rieske (2Fe-2S) protein [Acetobacteraceae bacterium]